MMTARGRGGSHSICANFLVLLNFLLFAAMTAIAAHLYDSWATGKGSSTALFGTVAGANALLLALIAGSVGMATSLLGFIHSGFWNENARFASLSANMVTLGLTWLSAGLTSRSLRSRVQNNGSGHWKSELIAVNALNIILMLTTLLYVLHIGLFKHVGHNNVNTVHNNTGTLPHHHKVVDTAAAGGVAGAAGAHHHNNRAPGNTVGGNGTNNVNGLNGNDGPYTSAQHHPVV